MTLVAWNLEFLWRLDVEAWTFRRLRRRCHFLVKTSTPFHSSGGGVFAYSAERSEYMLARKSLGADSKNRAKIACASTNFLSRNFPIPSSYDFKCCNVSGA